MREPENRWSCILSITAVLSVLLFSTTGIALGQCIISNPSFEIGGSGGAVFGGWNQFGYCGSTTDAVHGSMAARITGPDWGTWEMSGYWQEFDTSPGDQWVASAKCWHTGNNPLTGSTEARINIEWRDSGGSLINFESHTAASASTPTGEVQDFSVTSGPAPTGVARVRLLLGVLQYSGDPQADVYYDLADFNKVGTPYQWNDFPGGETMSFSGRTWRIKGPGYYGPGPNNFCDNSNCTWVDAEGRLHVTVKKISGTWYSTEVVLEEALGYGDYMFTTVGRLDQLDPSVVLGLFLWQYGPCWDPSYLWWNPYNEIDIEFSRWGDPGAWLGQFVAQPYDWGGNIDRFDASFSEDELATHAFRWEPGKVEFRSWRGRPEDESPESMIHEWTYTGPHIPRPEQPRIHVNLWKCCGDPPADQEVILEEFRFYPLGAVVEAEVPGPVTHLSDAVPNPFNPVTTIGYTIDREGFVEITVYDITGRYIETLTRKFHASGGYEVEWNGKNASGNPVASGVYFCQLKTGTVVETKKMVLMR